MPRAAAIYCRLSQDRTGHSLGIDRQEQLCRQIADQHGWPVTDVYIDRDTSAFKETARPGYDAMLQAIRAGHATAIIAVDQDRLSRRLSVLARLIDELGRADVPIVLASGELDTTTADGRLRAQMLGAIAEHESAKKSERIRRQRAQAAERGDPHPGRRPFGYTPDKTALDPIEAPIVRELVERYLTGTSLRQLAFDLNARQIPTVSGRPWGVTSLRTVLANPRLAGLRVHQGQIVGDANWPAIIDRPTHERLVAALNDPRNPKAGRPPTSLLGGILTCGKCGQRMHQSRRPNGQRRYVCNQNPRTGGCGRIAIDADQTDREIEAQVLVKLADPSLSASLSATPDEPGSLLAAGIEARERQLEQAATDHYAEGLISRAQLLAVSQRLEGEIAGLRRQLARERRRDLVAPLVGIDAGVWTLLGVDRQRVALGELVEQVVVGPHPAGRTTKSFDPERITITWT